MFLLVLCPFAAMCISRMVSCGRIPKELAAKARVTEVILVKLRHNLDMHNPFKGILKVGGIYGMETRLIKCIKCY